MEEKIIWSGSPSQWKNVGVFIFSVLLCWLVLPVFIALWAWLTVKTWKIEISEQRITEEKGVLSKTTDELELYRVKDIKLDQPFFLRLVGLSNIILSTSDRSHPFYTIPAVPNGKELRAKLRDAVEARRDAKGVVERDYN